MADEPEVLEIIKKNKRRILFNKINMLLSSFICLLVVVVVILVSLRAGKINGKGVYAKPGSIAIEGLIILMFFMTLIALAVLHEYRTVKSKVNAAQKPDPNLIASPPTSAESATVSNFQNGLDGVSAAFGQTAPELWVSSFPGTAAFSYMLSKGRPVVAVTRQALKAELSSPEAEALMAHETAHFSLGNVSAELRSRADSLASGIFVLTLTAFLGAFIFAMVSGLFGELSSNNDEVAIFIYLAFIPAVAMAVYFGMQVKAINRHNDLLADSLACMATGNPTALKNALLKLMPLGLLSTWDPLNEQLITRKKGSAVIVSTSSFRMPWSTTRAVDPDERLKNIEAIELGHWPSFDDLMKSRPGRGKISTRVSEGFQLAFLSACIVGLLVLVAFTGAWFSNAKPFTETAVNTSTPKPEPDNPGTISAQEFDSLKKGMSYKEAVAIIDGVGKPLISWSQDIRYYSSDGQRPGGARLDFKNGILNEKAWLEQEPVPMTFEELCAQFRRGMTYEQFRTVIVNPPIHEVIKGNTRVCYWAVNHYGFSAFAVFIDNGWQHTGSGNMPYEISPWIKP